MLGHDRARRTSCRDVYYDMGLDVRDAEGDEGPVDDRPKFLVVPGGQLQEEALRPADVEDAGDLPEAKQFVQDPRLYLVDRCCKKTKTLDRYPKARSSTHAK